MEILTFREKVKTQAVRDYLQRVVLSILQTQDDGTLISLMVYNNPKILVSTELHRISKQWLPRNMHEVKYFGNVTFQPFTIWKEFFQNK